MTEHELHVGGTTGLELQGDEVSVVGLPVGDEVDLVEVGHGVHLDESELGGGVHVDGGAVLVVLRDADLEVREDAADVGVVAPAGHVGAVSVEELGGTGLGGEDGDEAGAEDDAGHWVPGRDG